MFCKKCGFALDDDAVFCSKCGTPTNVDSNNTPQEMSGTINDQNQQINTPHATQPQANNQQQNPASFNNNPANSYNQQPNTYNNWQQSPNQYNNYPSTPAAHKRNNQTIILISIASALVLAGLIFGGYMLFFRDSSSTSTPINIENAPINKSIKEVIIGTWDGFEAGEKTSEVTLKFEKNGKCSIDESGDTSNGTYTIDDSDKSNVRIEIISDAGWDSAFYIKKINNDKLEFTDEDDVDREDIITFIRKK